MMGVFIKGMEMPQNCDKCRFQSALRLYCDAMPYNFCGNTDDIERPDWCPLVEIPTPHGRMIAEKTITEIRYHDADGYHIVNGEQLCELEIDAETVIEPEGREE